ncbi:CapA family protein [Pseudalkalibacillus hwajinpoensis]|uniref:CapA family protein n=1 Tax=Guptibacillus hwajinpoensis TaxID=208199 RepID=A0A4U1MFN6_9BACL|nr:CapA family protein [Pseudalkalibacillus hwajinpoensis]TKD69182.1 CapA family protein [Pseudalkalibacillus hwajinpoensis]
MKKITLSFVLLVIVVAGLSFFLSRGDELSAERTPLDLSTYQNDISPAKSNQSLSNSSLTLAAVGDILIHDRVYEKAVEGRGYNFNPMLSKVQKQLQDADITFANQETVIGGTAIGLSSYPSFNSPTEVGDALKTSGVDIISMANNHTLDRGEKAIQNAIKYWNKLGILYTGSYASEKDRTKIRTIEQNGISIAFLAYTYGTNGLRPPSGKPYLVNYIDKKLMKKEILKAKKIADAVVVSIHFGNEYERYPNNDQLALSSFIAEAGGDLILGHHPHVLQPLEWIETTDNRKVLVAYSLGNFLSGQRKDYKDIGGILKVNIVKKQFRGNSTIILTSPSFTPTFVDKNYHVNPLSEVNPVLLKEINQHMKQWIPELQVPEA